MRKRGSLFGVGVILVTGSLLACGMLQRSRTQVEMEHLYSQAYQLFTLVWDPAASADPSQQIKAKQLVDSLAHDFHRVGKAGDLRREDPVVAVTLDVTQKLLADSSRDFHEGRAEHGLWRLRSLVHSCVACHSRFGAAATFYGSAPVAEPQSYAAAMNMIEFLVASRQFGQAAERAHRLAERASTEPEFAVNLIPALRMWLLLEIRTLDRPWEAADRLEAIHDGAAVSVIDSRLIERWIGELRALSSKAAIESPIDHAEALLQPVRKNVKIADDDWYLVSTLRASLVLHEFLATHDLSGGLAAKANFLLALSYQHMNIPAFDASRDLYLERCIRAFPGTPEAKEAFHWYEWDVRQSSTGSGGTHLDEVDRELLNELSGIAAVPTEPKK